MSKSAPGTSKKLKLLRYRGLSFFFLAIEYLHHSKLLVGNGQDPYVTAGRQAFLDPSDMYIRVLPTGTVPHVRAKLKHAEAVLQHLLAEFRIILPVVLGFRGQIEKHHDPHNAVFIQPHKLYWKFRIQDSLSGPLKAFCQRSCRPLHSYHEGTPPAVKNDVNTSQAE